ncbi:sensor histidine kinase [Xanthovirga aplysinae]|uniref:sensor histidine kinase n=1 Tax=Xanthovirga aplysinae TaxID=2529853 RepID=UPI0012BBAF7C|nr:histidine kinase [Xanthovirga aplysinae]MTI30469.1 hypothetical protein [Xanthovirga aplysinae]
MVNPILKNKTYLLAYFLFWVMLTVVQTVLLQWSQDLYWLQALVEAGIYCFGFSLVGLAIWYIVRYTDLEKGSLWNALSSHLAAAAFLIFIWLEASYYLTALLLEYSGPLLSSPIPGRGWKLALGTVYYLLIVLIYYLLIFYQNYQEKKIREIEMQSALKETELSMLKAQINPHFIFNSLNSISSLTLTRPEDAHEMIVKLSSFLRHTIGHAETELVPIKKELETIQLYLDIEKLRFGKKLNVKFEGSNSIPEEVLVPNLILQPLIENAIKYGAYESISISTIEVRLSFSGRQLEVEIINSLEPDALPKKGKGIGLKNVRGRLQLIYESADLLKTNKELDQYKVQLTIPQLINQQ